MDELENFVLVPRVQIPGFLLWTEQRGERWFVVDADGKALSRGLRTERDARCEAAAMTDTRGT